MDREQLINILSESLLWEVVAANVEKVDQIPIMLQNIDYIESIDDVISKITECEVLDSDFHIFSFAKDEESILISFEITFLLSVWNQDQQLLKITATAIGKCRIPDIENYDWGSVDFEDMNRKELLAKGELVDIFELMYSDIEADDICII